MWQNESHGEGKALKDKALFVFWWIFLRLYPWVAIPYMRIKENSEVWSWKRHQKRRKKAQKWIASQLKQKGIKVLDQGLYYVHADDASDQIVDFQAVYAEALKNFSDLTSFELCGWAKPWGLLDKEWATRVGIDEYSAPQYTEPCIGCGKQDIYNFRWGNEEFHKELMHADYFCVLRSEYRELAHKPIYICRNCESKYTTIQRNETPP